LASSAPTFRAASPRSCGGTTSIAARGLLLDLVATDDDEGVDAAAACFHELLRWAGERT
jgi:hypothetical protein